MDFDEKAVQLTGGALTELSIRLYGDSLTKSSRFTEGRLTTTRADLWTTYTIPLDCRPDIYGMQDTDLLSGLWKEATSDEIERELRNLIDGEEFYFQKPSKPTQKGLFDLRSLSTHLDNISYTSLALSLDRLAPYVNVEGSAIALNPGDHLLDADIIEVRPDAVTLKRYFSKTPVSSRETETVVIPRPKT